MKGIGKRVAALTMAVLLVSMMAISAFAYDEKTVEFKNDTVIELTTPKGWKYLIGLKETYLIITNKGTKPIYVSVGFAPKFTLEPKQSRAFSCPGSGRKFNVTVERSACYARVKQVKVVTDVGSLNVKSVN